MTDVLKVTEEILWNNRKIGWPPIQSEFTLNYEKITKALFSFKYDMSGSWGTKLDIEQPIKINGQIVKNLDLPTNPGSPTLKSVERNEIEIVPLLKTGEAGVVNTIEVNYKVATFDHVKLAMPGSTLGTLSAKIKLYYVDGGGTGPGEKHCMNCGSAIPFASVVCPFCKLPKPSGGEIPKPCSTCGIPIPDKAKYCEAHGHKQAAPAGSKLCVRPDCPQTLNLSDMFCPKCGTPQPTIT
jgi:hypothetical protein